MTLKCISDNCYKVNDIIFIKANKNYCYVIDGDKVNKITLEEYNNTKQSIMQAFGHAIILSPSF